jgi:eukaryotic-like serine/threonine-protein kinase
VNYGRYEIIKEVGRGSMGVVYQARDPHIGRLIAVKVMRRDRMENETFVKRFMKEAKVIGRLSHPQVVTIFDVGEEQGEIYIAMEFLEGTPLSDVIKERRLDAREITAFGIQIAETLDYAHRKGVVHRDIKPSNIVVEPDGRTKITDFGIARIEDPSATLQTQTGVIMGTPAYMSPEQVLGSQVDGRSDIFSLGVILYELSTGKRPFGGDGKTLATVFNDVIANTPQEPHIAATSISLELSGIIMKALRKEPAERFQTGKEMAEALKGCLEKPESTLESKPESILEPKLESKFESKLESKLEPVPVMGAAVQKKKPGNTIPIVIAIMLAVVTGVGYYFYQGRQIPQPRNPPQTRATPPNVTKNQPSQTQVKPNIPSSMPDADRTKTEKPVKNQTALPQHGDAKHEERKVPKEVAPPPAVKPLPKPATLVVRTTPPGANIHVDGKLKGTAPLTLRLPKGEHRIRATLAGYERLDKQLVMEEAKTYSFTLGLKTVAESDGWVVKPLVDRPKE